MSPFRLFGCAIAFAVVLAIPPTTASAQSFTFEQLDWQGIGTPGTDTPDSMWGRVTIDFVGYSSLQYFNLNVNGNWVVQNMGIASLFGTGNAQTVTTTFQIAPANGSTVFGINWGFNIANAPGIDPGVSTFGTPVGDLAYMIGGEGGVDLGGAGAKAAPAAPAGANAATVTMSATLPNIGSMPNQPQAPNQCAPGAVSNSLMYLQATGGLSNTLDTSIATVGGILGTDATGTPANWYLTKQAHYANHNVETTFLGPNDIMDLINAVNAGKDVEIDLVGHVAVVVGVRKFSDGRIELDIYDDNQTDNMSDPVRTVQIVGGMVDGMVVERFVVESVVPTPAALPAAASLLVALGLRRRRR